ncbi:Hint domain-containing protein [Paracoccus sp. XHP0099]|uniref:Hint domain-containing protein n=2 Tax=Paracoccus marinaquae TaxID=2841926 RepID=A0ABS6AH60_9RHOB|nr:Hint domain-containing protein [Paracoccus marinaquae]
MIHLGSYPDVDAQETFSFLGFTFPEYDAERAYDQINGQTAGSAGAPLYGRVTAVTMNDDDANGSIQHNNAAGTQETVSYTLNGEFHENEIDSAIVVSNVAVTRLLPDGSTDTIYTTVRIFQDVSGNAFMMPPPASAAAPDEIAALTTYPIVSITMSTDEADYDTYFSRTSTELYDQSSFVPCFAAGTMILTEAGERKVEDLEVGDLVWTRDHGFQPVRWRGLRSLSASELAASPRLRPIRILANALGPNRPDRDLTVSPQHRILVRSQIAQRMFNAPELLVAARQLTEVPGIEELTDAQGVSYVHLLFDRHEVLMSNGAETESLYPGPQTIEALGEAAEEVFTLFPQLRDDPAAVDTARPLAAGRRARQLARRHATNQQPLAN